MHLTWARGPPSAVVLTHYRTPPAPLASSRSSYAGAGLFHPHRGSRAKNRKNVCFHTTGKFMMAGRALVLEAVWHGAVACLTGAVPSTVPRLARAAAAQHLSGTPGHSLTLARITKPLLASHPRAHALPTRGCAPQAPRAQSGHPARTAAQLGERTDHIVHSPRHAGHAMGHAISRRTHAYPHITPSAPHIFLALPVRPP